MNVSRCIDDLVRAVNEEFTAAHFRRVHSAFPTLTAPRSVSKLEQHERDLILLAVAQCDGNRLRAAELLGIGKTTLYRKLKEVGVITL